MPLRFPYSDAPQTAFPLGGIGAGSICLNAAGGLQDFSIRHRPHTTAEPENLDNITAGHETTLTAFATLRINGDPDSARVLEGPLPEAKVWCFGLKSQGYRMGGYEGLPRLQRTTFSASFPFAEVTMEEDGYPVRIQLTAFSPFVPGDEQASGMPAAILEYRFSNPGPQPLELEFAYHLSHLPRPSNDEVPPHARNAVIPGRGVRFDTTGSGNPAMHGSATLTFGRPPDAIKARWFRGNWFDAISMLWNEIRDGTFSANVGNAPTRRTGRNGGSVLSRLTLAPGASETVPVILCWHFPVATLSVGGLPAGEHTCCGQEEEEGWKPWYATRWSDAAAVAEEIHACYVELRRRSDLFRACLERSTLPEPALEAVSANLAILRSPTILRQENGQVWGWEGCFDNSGCCHGSCTHVWNYAQAIAHLFPALERTLRHQEYEYSMDEGGHVTFRSALPLGPVKHDYHAASDGQLGGILKLYRDWRICGDTHWMLSLYPLARQALLYAIGQWDPDREGWVREPHHNTYDIEFWGPDGMITVFYHFALQAMEVMAQTSGDEETGRLCRELAAASRRRLRDYLFNGEYLFQWTRWEDLRDRHFLESLPEVERISPEEGALLRAEGPKYQYGNGCLSDAALGAWMAQLCGITEPTVQEMILPTLDAVFRHNFRSSLQGHANAQRPGFALHAEGGLLVCTWPRGGRPSIPFPYSDEVFTGIEYQVASHLILNGREDEGTAIVRTTRARYTGTVRNPFCEYECGNYYIRALSSYALLQAYSGFRYDAVEKSLHLHPAPSLHRAGAVFFATQSAWGVVSWENHCLVIEVAEGALELRSVAFHTAEHSWDREGRWVVTPPQPLKLS